MFSLNMMDYPKSFLSLYGQVDGNNLRKFYYFGGIGGWVTGF